MELDLSRLYKDEQLVDDIEKLHDKMQIKMAAIKQRIQEWEDKCIEWVVLHTVTVDLNTWLYMCDRYMYLSEI